jgi:hypothetical protein
MNILIYSSSLSGILIILVSFFNLLHKLLPYIYLGILTSILNHSHKSLYYKWLDRIYMVILTFIVIKYLYKKNKELILYLILPIICYFISKINTELVIFHVLSHISVTLLLIYIIINNI